MAKSKDLFDDTTMSFGEHLEVLRVHLWKAIIGLVVCVCVTLFFGQYVVAFIRAPIDAALERNGISGQFVVDDLPPTDGETAKQAKPRVEETPEAIPISFDADELARLLHQLDGDRYPLPAESRRTAATSDRTGADAETAEESPPATGPPAKRMLVITGHSPYFAQWRAAVKKLEEPITLTVEEAFMTYLKVSLITGIVLSAPWIFYQIWLFVAAGLYPHERRYVHVFLPLSLGLFLGGAALCFFFVFRYVLDFLLSFNEMLGVTPQIRLSEWISFAVLLPMMFGVSFQLPLVMLFLERISMFDVRAYQEKRRLAIFVMSIIAMLLTPAEPISMMMMFVPLVLLYELGILMCKFAVQREGSPFPSEAA